MPIAGKISSATEFSMKNRAQGDQHLILGGPGNLVRLRRSRCYHRLPSRLRCEMPPAGVLPLACLTWYQRT